MRKEAAQYTGRTDGTDVKGYQTMGMRHETV
jgi:hypothetical protein